MKKKFIIGLMLASITVSSCENDDWGFPDYETQAVYFSYQSPVRTLVLGEDIFDTSLDNQHKFEIYATTGGVYTTKKDVTIGVEIDNTLATGLKFGNNGSDVVAMPSSYYQLASDKIVISKGKIAGGVQVQLEDAFFNDPLSINNNYVIPIKMKSVQNADSILNGKDYTLYAVKYVNKWHGNYLRRGKDNVVGKNGNTALTQTIVRHKAYVENDEVKKITTKSLSQITMPLTFKNTLGQNINFDLLLNFDSEGNCTISSGTNAIIATGSGKFISKGEKYSWGAKDRDALYLSYDIEMNEMSISSKDTLVIRDRAVEMEVFSPVNK